MPCSSSRTSSEHGSTGPRFSRPRLWALPGWPDNAPGSTPPEPNSPRNGRSIAVSRRRWRKRPAKPNTPPGNARSMPPCGSEHRPAGIATKPDKRLEIKPLVPDVIRHAARRGQKVIGFEHLINGWSGTEAVAEVVIQTGMMEVSAQVILPTSLEIDD